jgi:hypothetical protein
LFLLALSSCSDPSLVNGGKSEATVTLWDKYGRHGPFTIASGDRIVLKSDPTQLAVSFGPSAPKVYRSETLSKVGRGGLILAGNIVVRPSGIADN